MLKWLAGAAASALLLAFPEASANGAREAMAQWARTVAPSLFPFMALMPLLTSPQAAAGYEVLLGGLTRRVYRLPGAAASALIVGMLGGAPAGCAAAASIDGLTRGQRERLALSMGGLSPAFMISGVGGMLGSPALGRRLLAAQIAVQLLMPLLLIPFCPSDAPSPPADARANPPLAAVLNIGGMMALFGAVGAALAALLGPSAGRAALCLTDVVAGARILCGVGAPLPALAALTGFGGLCVCAQCLSLLPGVNPAKYIAARAAAAAISAGIVCAQDFPWPACPPSDALRLSCFFACILAVPAILRLKRTIT